MREFTVKLTMEEMVDLEMMVVALTRAIMDKEREQATTKIKKHYELILRRQDLSKKRPEVYFNIRHANGQEDGFGIYPLPVGFKFETICKYLFWRVNQLLITLSLENSFNSLFDLTGLEPDKAFFEINRHYDAKLEINFDTIALILKAQSGERVYVCDFSYDTREKSWFAKQTDLPKDFDKIIGGGLFLVTKDYPNGHPNIK
jgi:hypothetical protein